MYLGLNPSLTNKKMLPIAEIPQNDSIPDEFDWRNHNAVTPVKNQVFQCYIILVLITIILLIYIFYCYTSIFLIIYSEYIFLILQNKKLEQCGKL